MANLSSLPRWWAGATIGPSNTEPQVVDTVPGAIGSVSRFNIADTATGNLDVINTGSRSIRILDVWVVKIAGAGAAGNTIQVLAGTSAITEAMDTNVADKAIVRAATIDDANHNIIAGGTLRIARVKSGGNAACIVYISHTPL